MSRSFFADFASVSCGCFNMPSSFGKRGWSVCEVTYRWSHTLVAPQECSPRINVPLEFQSDYGQFRDIQRLTTDSVFIGRDFAHDSMIAEIIGPC